MQIPIKRLRPAARLPRRQTGGAAACDLHAAVDGPVVLEAGQITLVPTGVAVAIPEGYAGLVMPRSGLAARGLMVLNGPGLIDPDYRGEVKVILGNVLGEPLTIEPGDRIAQFLLVRAEDVTWQEVENLDPTGRGTGGFGSTGLGS